MQEVIATTQQTGRPDRACAHQFDLNLPFFLPHLNFVDVSEVLFSDIREKIKTIKSLLAFLRT